MIGTFLSWKVSGNGPSVRSIYFRTEGSFIENRAEKRKKQTWRRWTEGQSTQIPRYSTTIRKIRERRSSSTGRKTKRPCRRQLRTISNRVLLIRLGAVGQHAALAKHRSNFPSSHAPHAAHCRPDRHIDRAWSQPTSTHTSVKIKYPRISIFFFAFLSSASRGTSHRDDDVRKLTIQRYVRDALYRYRNNPEYALVATCTKKRRREVRACCSLGR